MSRLIGCLFVSLVALAAPPALAQSNQLEKPPGIDSTPAPTPAPPSAARPSAPASPSTEKAATPNPDDTEPVVTIRQDGENRIEEFRVNGRLYAVRVTPKYGKPYTMVDQNGSGHMERAPDGADDIAGRSVRPPRWVLFEF